jgi:hypothetical protein
VVALGKKRYLFVDTSFKKEILNLGFFLTKSAIRLIIMFAKKENPHSTVNQKNDLIFNYKSKAEKTKWSFHDIYL